MRFESKALLLRDAASQSIVKPRGGFYLLGLAETNPMRVSLAICRFALLLLAAAATTNVASAATSGAPGVLAGSGRVGFADGSSMESSFIEPLGIVSDGHGGLIVADAGAQRIRSIDANGSVRTIAGSGPLDGFGLAVAGGYADGPAPQARFNHPTSVAVAKDGTIYIADSRNHCIRQLKNGVVSTFAGRAGDSSGRDGNLATATFGYPRSLALGADGSLYVADWSKGLRAISTAGQVTTIALPSLVGLNVITTSIAGPPSDQRIYVGNGVQTFVYDVVTHETGLFSHNPDDRLDALGNVEGGEGTGNPLVVDAISPVEWLYSDTQRDTIHYVHERFDTVLDVPPDLALQSPTGLAVLPDGRVAVADTGHRRIVALAAVDRRIVEKPTSFPSPIPSGAYRIALVGDSFVYYDVRYSDSIAEQVQSKLEVREARNFDVLAFRFGPFGGIRDYVKEVLSNGLTDAVVLVVESNTMILSYKVPYWSDLSKSKAIWQAPFERDLKDVAASLSAAHIPLVVVVHPTANEVGPLERIAGFEREGVGLDSGSQNDSEASISEVVARLHLPCTLDLQQTFVEHERAVPHVPLFGSADFHFTPVANTLVAGEIVKLLDRCAPWRNGGKAGAKP